MNQRVDIVQEMRAFRVPCDLRFLPRRQPRIQIAQQMTGFVLEFGNFVFDRNGLPLRRHTAAGEDLDAVIDVRAVFQQGVHTLDYAAMPALLRPRVGRYGLCDYEKVFCADASRGGDIFEVRGIDRAAGCMVIVRPDQHVGHVLPLDARVALAGYFAGILRARTLGAKG